MGISTAINTHSLTPFFTLQSGFCPQVPRKWFIPQSLLLSDWASGSALPHHLPQPLLLFSAWLHSFLKHRAHWASKAQSCLVFFSCLFVFCYMLILTSKLQGSPSILSLEAFSPLSPWIVHLSSLTGLLLLYQCHPHPHPSLSRSLQISISCMIAFLYIAHTCPSKTKFVQWTYSPHPQSQPFLFLWMFIEGTIHPSSLKLKSSVMFPLQSAPVHCLCAGFSILTALSTCLNTYLFTTFKTHIQMFLKHNFLIMQSFNLPLLPHYSVKLLPIQ